MRLAFVVQRYGPVITGGAEQLCRQVAEQLAGDFDIDVLTTTAKDYTLWRNYYVPGLERHHGVAVRRFPIDRFHHPRRFRWQTRLLFRLPHTLRREVRWIEAQGPYTPRLVKYLREHVDDYDLVVFFSYRYYPTFFGVPVAPNKSIVVPTAEHDDTIYLRSYRRFFELPRGFVFLTEEERELVSSVSRIDAARSTIAGVGIDIPPDFEPGRFRQTYPIVHRFVLYLGRVHENKGCGQMFDFIQRYFAEHPEHDIRLVLVGARAMSIPRHERILHLGFLTERDKYDALSDCDLLIMPSRFESLSMVTLEAMAMGRPVLANAECEVLAGHCRRSGAGVAYRGYEQFSKGLSDLLTDAERRQRMGESGRLYIRENYTWSVVRRRYRDFLISMMSAGAPPHAPQA
jgi:glycosyltransferase involved in cell wall biosynthesis